MNSYGLFLTMAELYSLYENFDSFIPTHLNIVIGHAVPLAKYPNTTGTTQLSFNNTIYSLICDLPANDMVTLNQNFATYEDAYYFYRTYDGTSFKDGTTSQLLPTTEKNKMCSHSRMKIIHMQEYTQPPCFGDCFQFQDLRSWYINYAMDKADENALLNTPVFPRVRGPVDSNAGFQTINTSVTDEVHTRLGTYVNQQDFFHNNNLGHKLIKGLPILDESGNIISHQFFVTVTFELSINVFHENHSLMYRNQEVSHRIRLLPSEQIAAKTEETFWNAQPKQSSKRYIQSEVVPLQVYSQIVPGVIKTKIFIKNIGI